MYWWIWMKDTPTTTTPTTINGDVVMYDLSHHRIFACDDLILHLHFNVMVNWVAPFFFLFLFFLVNFFWFKHQNRELIEFHWMTTESVTWITHIFSCWCCCCCWFLFHFLGKLCFYVQHFASMLDYSVAG